MHAMLRNMLSVPLETHISNLMILRFVAQHYCSERASRFKIASTGSMTSLAALRSVQRRPLRKSSSNGMGRTGHYAHKKIGSVHILSLNSFLFSTILPGKVSRKLVVSARKLLLRNEVGGRDGASVRSSLFDASLPSANKAPLKFFSSEREVSPEHRQQSRSR
ncbi:hypothetical protein F1559_000113 [Cyanidiococcus yangmingshanensis]|uniref:Uncharacterized protein n=1 Tax=Cyanidiococcus yangmingshanensis TaxID=2690220 RepID=A0A7J7IIN4_9RHOD|nr:hypothetical protein F1559_000113 [Cyanidiococcus yangmingshanensis]